MAFTFLPTEEVTTLFANQTNSYQGIVAKEIVSVIYDTRISIACSILSKQLNVWSDQCNLEEVESALFPKRLKIIGDAKEENSLLDVLDSFVDYTSRSELKRLCKAGGIYADGQRLETIERVDVRHSPGNYVLLAIGKHSPLLLKNAALFFK